MIPHFDAESLDKAEVVLFGVPLKIGSHLESNSYDLAPKKIRDYTNEVFAPLKGKLPKAIDYGDIEISNKNLSEDLDRIYFTAREYLEKNKKLVFLGGNHLISYPVIKAIRDLEGEVSLVFFDAHPDSEEEDLSYASFVRYLIEEKVISNIIYIGINNPSYSELDFIKRNNLKCYTSVDVKYNMDGLLKDIQELVDKADNVYVSIDLDVFAFDGAHWLEPFGILPVDYLKILYSIRWKNVIGFDLVEAKNAMGYKIAAKLLIENLANLFQ